VGQAPPFNAIVTQLRTDVHSLRRTRDRLAQFADKSAPGEMAEADGNPCKPSLDFCRTIDCEIVKSYDGMRRRSDLAEKQC